MDSIDIRSISTGGFYSFIVFFFPIHHWGISFGTAGMKIRFDVPRLQAFRFVMGVPQARWMAENMENPMKMDDLGVPPFLETSI